MGIKEERRLLIAINSPARYHSMNQKVMKRNLELEEAWEREISIPGEEIMSEFVLDKAKLAEELPLGQEFLAGCLDFMIDVARRRTYYEEQQEMTIPQRVKNIIEDVRAIYNFAIEKGLYSVIVVVNDDDLRRAVFYMRREFPRHSHIFSIPSLLPMFNDNRLPEFRCLSGKTQAELVQGFCKVFRVNLTSCDFGLQGEELVAERVKCYGYTLDSLAKLTYALFGNLSDTRVFDLFLEGARRTLNTKR